MVESSKIEVFDLPKALENLERPSLQLENRTFSKLVEVDSAQ